MSRLTRKLMGKVVIPIIPMEIKSKEDLDKYHEVRREYEAMVFRLAEYEDKEEKSLKIFEIYDGEQHNIVANSEEEAMACFLEEMNFGDIQKCDLLIREIKKGDGIEVNLNGDSDLLLQLINRYRKNMSMLKL